MCSFKATASALLLAALLGASPAAPGVDELGRLFPADVLLYAEVSRVSQIAAEWKEHLASFLPVEKRAELLAQLEKSAKTGFNRLPERLLKDLDRALPTVGNVAVAARQESDGLSWSAAFSSSDPALFTRIVNEDLRVFASQELLHAGVTILEIRKVGEIDLQEASFLIAAVGPRLLLSSHRSALTGLIDRSKLADPGEGVHAHPAFRKLRALPGDLPAFRGFLGGMGELADRLSGQSWSGGRSSAHEQDKMSALLGLDQIGGLSVEATFRPGDVRSTARLDISAPCPLYDLWRQPAGPKELLKLIPASSPLVLHANLKSGADLLEKIKRMIRRAEEMAALSLPPGAPKPDYLAEFSAQFESESGVTTNELFSAIGDEVMFAMGGGNPLGDLQQIERSFLFGIKTTDPIAAKRLLEKLTAKLGEYERAEVEGADLFTPKDGDRGLPVLALKGSACLLALSREILLAALKPPAGVRTFADVLPAEALRSSKLLSFDLGLFWKAGVAQMGPEVPQELRDLQISARSILFTEEREEAVLLSTHDSGVGFLLQALSMSAPLAMMAMFSGRDPAALAVELQPDPPAELPAEQVAARVKALVLELASDDLEKRDNAGAALKALGPQAVRPASEAFRASSDAEVRNQLLGLLMSWKAYDAAPEVLARKVTSFIDGFGKKADDDEPLSLVEWQRENVEVWSYVLEPFVNTFALQELPHGDVLENAEGASRVAAAVVREDLPLEQRRRLAAALAFRSCSKAGSALLKAGAAAKEPDVKLYVQIALGWSPEELCRAAVAKGLVSEDVWMRRASFIAAGRSTDPGMAGTLIGLLKSPDFETRWNASYTLKELTGGRLKVNVYGPASELDRAAAWWASNKATFKPGR